MPPTACGLQEVELSWRTMRFIRDLAFSLVAGFFVTLVAVKGGQHPETALVDGVVAFLLIGLAAALLENATVRARLPSLALERGNGIAIRVRPPERGGRRRLRRQTAELVKDIREYLKAQPAPYVDSMREHQQMSARMQNATETERHAIWQEYSLQSTERFARESQELAARFGGRLIHLSTEYQRRGLLSQSDAHKLQWEANSLGWLGSAASELGALALRL